jgi:hypothetical protein
MRLTGVGQSREKLTTRQLNTIGGAITLAFVIHEKTS